MSKLKKQKGGILMYRGKKVTGVILAGGSGRRMGAGENKVYLELDGKPIILHSVVAFSQHPMIDQLVFVAHPEELERAKALLTDQKLETPWRLVPGGKTRQESVYHALEGERSAYVLIHDGARPFVKEETITACIQALDKSPGVVVASPVVGEIYKRPRRKAEAKRLKGQLYGAQTPQGFQRKILQKCHEQYRGEDCSDDSLLLEKAAYPVSIILGEKDNIKLTHPLDLKIARG